MFHRRACLRLLTGLGLACAAGLPAAAQSFPSKPVRIVVPQTPGGASDALARVIAPEAQSKVEAAGGGREPGRRRRQRRHRAGRRRSPADGYTLLMSYVGTQAINGALYRTLPLIRRRTSQPVATLATLPFVCRQPELAVTDLEAVPRRSRARSRIRSPTVRPATARSTTCSARCSARPRTVKLDARALPRRGPGADRPDGRSDPGGVHQPAVGVWRDPRRQLSARSRSPARKRARLRHPSPDRRRIRRCRASTSIRGSACWRRPARRRRWCARSMVTSRRRCRRKTRSSASPARAPSPSSPRPSSSSPCFRPTWRSGARS